MPHPPPALSLRHRAEDLAAGAMIAALMRMPYERRIPAMGHLARRVIAPLAGYPKRIRWNLNHVFPDLPGTEVARLVRAVPDNLGRALIEQFSGAEFAERAARMPLHGPGLDAIAEARRAGRPVIVVTGHIGNHLAGLSALRARGIVAGGLYMPMTNPAFNRRYVASLQHFLTPAFPRGREGLAAMLRHLRAGGVLGVLFDQDMAHGAAIDFLGRPARTALSPAELALRHDALLVPGYSLRQPDGLSFATTMQAPIPHTDAMQMMQALNASLGAVVRANMDQWLWTHRRWKI